MNKKLEIPYEVAKEVNDFLENYEESWIECSHDFDIPKKYVKRFEGMSVFYMGRASVQFDFYGWRDCPDITVTDEDGETFDCELCLD